MSNDRIAQARALFEKFPGNDLARYNLAQAYCDAGEFAPAVDHLRALCANKSDWMVAHILLGKSLLQTGPVEEAKHILRHALQLAIAQHHDSPREELEQLLSGL